MSAHKPSRLPLRTAGKAAGKETMLTKQDRMSLDLTEEAAELVAEALRSEGERTRSEEALRAQLSEALRELGAAEDAVPLLLDRIEGAQTEGGRVTNIEELAAPLREAYPSLFEQPDRLCPPAQQLPPLRRADLARMSAEEINADWPRVKALLAGA